jgi:hypothetical protein
VKLALTAEQLPLHHSSQNSVFCKNLKCYIVFCLEYYTMEKFYKPSNPTTPWHYGPLRTLTSLTTYVHFYRCENLGSHVSFSMVLFSVGVHCSHWHAATGSRTSEVYDSHRSRCRTTGVERTTPSSSYRCWLPKSIGVKNSQLHTFIMHLSVLF